MSPKMRDRFVIAYQTIMFLGEFPSPDRLNREMKIRKYEGQEHNITGWQSKLRAEMLIDDGFYKRNGRWIR